ncbi:MAG: hypothetical protein MUF83_04620 [Acidimicrobiales bacterium]|nr:hypothetical protein [Acidimicrobiales bacterium]
MGEPAATPAARTRRRPPGEPPRLRWRHRLDDTGAGLFGTVAGVAVVLVFLLFAVQLLVGLHARSVVTSVAWAGARDVATADTLAADPTVQADARRAAESRMRAELGGLGGSARFDWSGSDADTVVLRVQADSPRFSLPGTGGPLVTDHIDRTVRIRVERPR